MNVSERIQMCRIIEKMQKQKAMSKRLGLENNSYFHGRPVEREDI